MLVYQRVNHVKPPLTGHVPSHVMTGPRPLRFAKERVCFGSDARNASVGTPGWIFCQGLPLAEKSTWHKWSDFHIQWIFMDNHDLYIHICIHCIWYIYIYIYLSISYIVFLYYFIWDFHIQWIISTGSYHSEIRFPFHKLWDFHEHFNTLDYMGELDYNGFLRISWNMKLPWEI